VVRGGLWRTTTFRLSALYGVIYLVGIILLLGVVYAAVADSLTRRSDAAVQDEMRILQRSGPTAVLRRFRSEAARDPLTKFALYSATGERIAGDSPLGPRELPPDGRTRAMPAVGAEPPSRAVAERAPWGEIIIVARDARQFGELRHIVLTALIGSGAVLVVLGIGMGLALSLQPLRRIQAMQSASEAIGAGDFALRLPVSPAQDEIDTLASIANRMMDEAERLMVQARTVGEGVAHELRSPLTRLRARLDHAAQGFAPDDPRRELLAGCVAEADAVLARFAALLRIAALEARGRRVGLGRASLSSLVDQVSELFGPLAAERAISLRAEREPDLEVEADRELLFEALCNLMDNALKFTPAEGHVTLRATTTRGGPLLEVSDTGPGIAEAERAFVTKRFYRSPIHAGVQGHGLGLSLVAAVADLHGFELTFEDARPGTVVRLLCGPRPMQAPGSPPKPEP
jgi:signal transduction histidine kinase